MPRTEDPALIRAAILAGAVGAPAGSARPAVEVREVAGRREAIEWALAAARAGDTVLVAGKGHETGQEMADQVVAFDDRVVAVEFLTRRLAGGRAS